MRIIIILLVAAFVMLTSFADGEGKLTISLTGDHYTVLVNGRIHEIAGNKVTIENIKSGEYRIRIYSYNPEGGSGLFKSPLHVAFVEIRPGQEVDLVVETGKLSVK